MKRLATYHAADGRDFGFFALEGTGKIQILEFTPKGGLGLKCPSPCPELQKMIGEDLGVVWTKEEDFSGYWTLHGRWYRVHGFTVNH